MSSEEDRAKAQAAAGSLDDRTWSAEVSDLGAVSPPPTPSISAVPAGTLRPGDVLSGRFKIVRFIAGGGMGQVYEAEDQLRQRRVALKTLLPHLLANPERVEQLRIEINNASQVSHPNVCRVYDLFREPVRALLFITMEFLDGELLSDYLKRSPQLPLPEIIDLAQQMAEGLRAAHMAGIVHQDFKPGNVILTRSGDKTRAIITDFGLALNLNVTGRERGMSGGTLPYMAPEQLDQSKELSAALDIYAYAVVIYQLLTGHLPIEATSREEFIRRKQTERPVAPRHYRKGISSETEQAILRCLAIDPKERFAEPTDLVRILDGTMQRRRRQLYFAGAAVLIVASLAASSGFFGRKWMVVHRTPSVAVLGFHNMTGNPGYDWLGTELAEGVTANLQGSKQLRTISSDEIVLARGEFPLASQDMERQDLSGVRNALGADFVVVGHYGVADDSHRLLLNFRVQNPRGDFVGGAIHEEGTEAEYRKLISEASAEIRRRIGTQALSENDADDVANVFPENADARRLYFESLAKLRALDAVSAVEIGQRAAASESDNAAIHSVLAEGYFQLKNMPRAREEAQRGSSLAAKARLPQEYRVATEARLDELNNHWDNAIDNWNSLYRLSRENLGYGLALANAQVLGNKRDAALKTLSDLESEPQPIGNDPRIAIEEAQTYSSGGQYRQEVTAASKALAAAQSRGWKMMEARADLELCWAQQRVSDPHAGESCRAAQSLMAVFKDSINSDVALNNLANWLMQFNQYQEAEAAYRHVIDTMNASDDPRDAAGAHLNEAKALLYMGQPEQAVTHIGHSIKLSHPIGDFYDEGRARVILARIKSDKSLADAEDEVRNAMNIARLAGDRETEGYALSNLAAYQQLDGNLDDALDSAKQALAVRKDLDIASEIAATLQVIGDIQFARGQLQEARDSYQKALTKHTDQERMDKADLEVALGQVELEASHLDAAEGAGQAALVLVNELPNSKNSQAGALILLSRVASKRKAIPDAKQLLTRAASLSPDDDDVQTLQQIAAAELSQAEGSWKNARDQFAAARKHAEDTHNSYLEAQARILEDQMALTAGDRSGANDLKKMQSDGSVKKFARLRERVAQLAKST